MVFIKKSPTNRCAKAKRCGRRIQAWFARADKELLAYLILTASLAVGMLLIPRISHFNMGAIQIRLVRSPTKFAPRPRKVNNYTTSERKPISQGGKPLNILLLYGDDWRWDSLGVQGNPFVKTPFLDKLARRGIRFQNNMVTTSICWMSRATLHTGLYASQHKGWFPLDPYWYHLWYDSFPYLMKEQQNYAMAHVGKWDYSYFHDTPQIWDTYNYSRIYHGKHWYSKSEVEQDTESQTRATKQTNYNTQYKTHTGDQIHVTDRTVAESIEFLQHRPKDQPFMLTVAFFPPHSVDGTEAQFFPQPETATFYPSNVTILPPVPPSFTVQSMNQSFARLPDSIFHKADGNEARTRWHLRFDDERKYNIMMKRYYQMITGVDKACETIVTELERQGILNETLVIFTTDNGFYHGEHGLAGKWFPHEESIRVPLIVLDPRAPPSTRGTVRDEMTLNIDLAPTLLTAAQTSIPEQMQGRDISQIYNHPSSTTQQQDLVNWREEFFYEHPQFWDDVFLPASTAVVNKKHKYIQWGSDPNTRVEQLFDLTKDPKEETDLSQEEEYAVLLEGMRTRHSQLQKECCVDVDIIGEKRGDLYNQAKLPLLKDPVAEAASELEYWTQQS